MIAVLKEETGFVKINESDREVEELSKVEGIIGNCFLKGKLSITIKTESDKHYNPLFDLETTNAIISIPVKRLETEKVLAVVQVEYSKNMIKGLQLDLESLDPLDNNLISVIERNLSQRLSALI